MKTSSLGLPGDFNCRQYAIVPRKVHNSKKVQGGLGCLPLVL